MDERRREGMPEGAKPPCKPRVLVIGGTQFMGRATVAALLQNGGYDLTILNRGRTESPFEGLVRHVACDRRKRALGAFIASEPAWHAVIDFVAFGPDDVRRIVPQHVDKLGLYILISTDSVYMASSATGFVHGPSGRLTEQSDAQPDAARAALDEYGANKRDLERLLAQHGRCSGLRCLCLRLPDVLGRHENTGRQHALIKRLVGGNSNPTLNPTPTLALNPTQTRWAAGRSARPSRRAATAASGARCRSASPSQRMSPPRWSPPSH